MRLLPLLALLVAVPALAQDHAKTAIARQAEAAGASPAAAAALARAVAPLQTGKLTASDATAEAQFGRSVSLSGDRALVGADTEGGYRGAVYVFAYDGTGWVEEAKLIASDGAPGDGFGISVSLSGDRALIGAFLDNDGGTDSGSAYVFAYDGTGWAQQAKLIAGDDAADDQFGISVSLVGDRALIGAYLDDDGGTDSGSAYVFAYDGTGWAQQAKLIAGDDAADDQFGISVSLSGDRALIGAHLDDDEGPSSGSAYVFAYDGTTWAEQAKLTASDGDWYDHFGISVSLSGDRALIGAFLDDDGGTNSGSAYEFAYDGTGWTQEAKLTASDAAAEDQFGRSVSLSGGRALVGADLNDDGGSGSGSAYVFAYDGTTWAEQAKLTASDGAAGDGFGVSVSLSGDRALVGAFLDDDGGTNSGSAYVFVTPANDNLANATAITGTSFAGTGANVGATLEAAEAIAGCGVGSPATTQSVWWRYDAPGTGEITLDLTGSTFDTVLSVWTGSGHPLTEEACDDDGGGGVISMLTMTVTGGTTYWIRVTGYDSGDTGDIALALEFGPPNDDLADATVITGYSFSGAGTTINSTAEASEVDASCEGFSGNSPQAVWWRYTAPADGVLTVDLSNSDFDTVLSIHTGASHPLTEVACDDDSGAGARSATSLNVVDGTEYLIRVAVWESSSLQSTPGEIGIDVTFGGEGVWKIVEGSGLETHFYGPPAPGYTVDDLATQNLVRGVPGFYPSANLTLWTTWDAATAQWSASAGTGEVLDLGRAFRWKLLDRDDKGDPAVSQSRTFPFVLQTTIAPNTSDVTVTLDTGGKFQNFLANPFGTPLDLTGIRTWPNGNDTRPGVHVWDPGTSSWSLAPSVIGPWEMFRVRSRRPRASGAPRLLTIPASARVLSRPASPNRTATVPALAFRLDGRTPAGRPLADRMLRLTFADDARAAFDADEDTEKYQPVSTAYVAIGARVPGAETLVGEDVRPFADAAVALALEAYGAERALTLSWDAETLPAGLPVVLVDLVTGVEVDVRAVSEYAFEAVSRPAHAEVPETDHIDGSASEDRFVLRIGSALAVEEPVTAVSLGVAPNPSSGGARVSFALPEAGPVLLAVYDVRGREVAMLAAGEMPAGRHEARLPGGLAAGVYVIRLEAAGAVQTRQAAVVR